MIDSLHIQNFKNLVDVNISGFSRINLISGKNNVGKSTLLEALRLYVADAQLIEIINGRGEIIATSFKASQTDCLKSNLAAFSSIFTNRDMDADGNKHICIDNGRDKLEILFFYYFLQEYRSDRGTFQSIHPVSDPAKYTDQEILLGLEIRRNGETSSRIPLAQRVSASRLITDSNTNVKGIENLICVSSNYDNPEFTSKLWDAITLTDKESDVIRALKIVDPDIENLAFLEDSYSRSRYPVAKVKGIKSRVPLRSMGDGINHILAIILAIVNSENGCVTIDEIDNGLHYTVQKQLWTIIFELAKSLNVQIFATTHSSDCISSFSKVLSVDGNQDEGRFIRLEMKGGAVTYTEYSPSELEIVAAQNIEIR